MEIIEINSFEDFLKVRTTFANEDFIFRGVSDSRFRLVPTLYRKILDTEDFNSKLEVMRKVFYHEDDVFTLIKDYECLGSLSLSELCKLQHYGIETRLLDFTKDIDIALTFSLCDFYEGFLIDEETDGAIYVLNKNDFFDENVTNGDEEMLAELIYNYNENDFSYIESEGKKASYPLTPKYFECNDENIYRIHKQNGCFILFPHSFEDHIEIRENQVVAKIILKSKSKKDLYQSLKYRMSDLK